MLEFNSIKSIRDGDIIFEQTLELS